MINTEPVFTPPRELLEKGIKTELQEEVSIDSVRVENSLIDPLHAQMLAESMMGERKQISPTTLRAKLENGEIVYDVIDGFHRSAAKRMIQDITKEPQLIKAIVLYGCPDEELYDLRVLAASSVKSIKFARMAEWMKSSFISTKWKNEGISDFIDRGDLTLSQVFQMALSNNSGRNLGFTPDQSTEIKEWAEKKSKQWGKPLGTIMIDMRTVEASAPDLVQKVRSGGGGKDGKGTLTLARLNAIVENLPGQWEIQRQFVSLAIDKNIVADDLDYLAFSYKNFQEAEDTKMMEVILTNPDFLLHPEAHKEEVPVEVVQKVKYQLPERPERRRLSSRSNGKASVPQHTQIQGEQLLENNTQKDITVNIYNELRSKNMLLTQSLREAHAMISQLQNKIGGENTVTIEWWNTIPDLPEIESKLLHFLFVENLDLEDAAGKLDIMDNQAINLLKSSIRRNSLYHQSLKENHSLDQ